MSKRLFAVIDTETTGLKVTPKSSWYKSSALSYKGSEVCQIGGLILDVDGVTPKKLFCHYCDTVAINSTVGAQEVHEISQKNVRQYICGQYLPEVITRWVPELLEPNLVLIGYNIKFDLAIIGQTLANSFISWDWVPNQSSMLPRNGRVSVDVMQYMSLHGKYLKLSSFEDELKEQREKFKRQCNLPVETNCIEMLTDSWQRSHSSFYDAVNTYLLWGERVWMRKLV